MLRFWAREQQSKRKEGKRENRYGPFSRREQHGVNHRTFTRSVASENRYSPRTGGRSLCRSGCRLVKR